MRKIYLTRGDDTTIYATVTEAYDHQGNPIDTLDGMTARFQARRHHDEQIPVISKDTTTGGVTIQGLTIKIQIDHMDTLFLEDGDILLADIELQDPTGRRTTIEIDGHPTFMICIRGDITRQ